MSEEANISQEAKDVQNAAISGTGAATVVNYGKDGRFIPEKMAAFFTFA
jgi:hypothetical protein